jgi:hypothetical protein
MSKIKLLDSLYSEYKIWTLKLNNVSKNIENNILQKDSSNKLEEKVVSIGISSVIMYIGVGIIGLFGIATGGVGAIVLFAIGWLLSKFINKKIFGSERNVEKIRDDEKFLLEKLEGLKHTHIQIRDRMNQDKNNVFVHFTNYPTLKREFNSVLNLLTTYDRSGLALKYRYKHSYVTNKYKVAISKFDVMYAHKIRG